MVAGAFDEVMQPGAFAAEDEADVLAEVEVGVVGSAALVEAYDPDVLLLHGFEGAGDVDDLGDADVLGGSGGGLGGDCAEGGGAALGEDDAVDAGAIGGAEESAEVVGVFYAVEGEKEFVGGGRLQEVFEGEEFSLADEGDDALVGVGLAVAGELVAGLGADADAFGAAEFEESVHAGVAAALALAGDADVVKRSSAGAEGLLNGVQAVQNIHPSSVLGEKRREEGGWSGLEFGQGPGERPDDDLIVRSSWVCRHLGCWKGGGGDSIRR